MAVAKQATTIATQTTLALWDLAVEMCTRPWIVELSKNSQRVAVAIFDNLRKLFESHGMFRARIEVLDLECKELHVQYLLYATCSILVHCWI